MIYGSAKGGRRFAVNCAFIPICPCPKPSGLAPLRYLWTNPIRLLVFMPRLTFKFFARLMIALLWFGAVNHCAVEGLAREVLGGSASSLADRVAGDCSTHSQDDATPHQEGAPCASSFIIGEPSTVSATAAAPLLFSFLQALDPLDYLQKSFSSSNGVETEALEHRPSSIKRLSLALSLAPNAPPHSL